MSYSYIARSRRTAVAEPLEARRLLAGQLDTSFGSEGLAYGGLSDKFNQARAVAVQADDKVVAAGYATDDGFFGGDFVVGRFLASGARDTGFGGGGVVRLDWGGDDGAEAVAVQPDGKIVVGGWVNRDSVTNNTNFGVARLLPDGSPDPTFGANGRVVTDFAGRTDQLYDLVLQPDGKILAAGVATTGSDQLALARYNPDGSLDQTFGTGGKVLATVNGNLSYAFAVAVQNDGKIVTTGTGASLGTGGGVRTLSISRFRADGSPDPTFGTGGWIVDNLGIAFPRSIAVAPDGGYYVGVTVNTAVSQHHTYLRKYTATGARAPGFGTNGGVQVAAGGSTQFPTEVVVRSDGQVLVAASDGGSGVGSNGGWAVAAVMPDGTLRPDFGTAGRAVTRPRFGGNGAAMALDSAGRILVAGHGGDEGYMAVARYTNDPVGTVFGTVFRDMDGDELQDPEDGPLAGWRVYADSNNNAVLDPGERTATTDATGRYEFRQLFAGSYVFRLAMQPGHVSGLASVQLPAVPGQAMQIRPWPVIRGAMMVGWVFNDLNRNGQMDNGEPPLVGTVVYVDADGDRRFDPGERNVRVDGSGLYRIALDVPGTASVRQVVPPGYRQVTPAEDADQRASAEPGQAYGSRNFVNIAQPVTVTSTSYGPAREWISFQFDRRMDLATLNMSRFTLTNVATGQTYTEFNENFTIGWPTTVTLEVAPGRLPTGNYRAVLRAGAISDYSGNTLAADVVLDFFVLDGDVNRDRKVDGTDFALLAGNFGRSGMTYDKGDLNGDGKVDGTDFSILAGNFGKTVAAPAVQPAAAAVRQQPVQPQPAVLRRRGRVRRDPRDPRTLRGR